MGDIFVYMTRHAPRLLVPIAVAIALMIGVAFAVGSAPFTADAAINHGQLVPESPRRDVPVVLDGAVYAHARLGDRIFVGGDFQQVALPDGTVLDQAYLFAYDIDTGVFDTTFTPVLNNAVRALEPSVNGDALYVGGRFWKWDDKFPLRVARLNADGSLDASFQASASAAVMSMAVSADTVYLAGDFTDVSGVARSGYAALDAATGAVDPDFVFDVGAVGSQIARGVVLSSDAQTLVGLHFGREINGTSREALMKVDLSGATPLLADWEVDWSGQQGRRECLTGLRDLAISPDGSYVVVGGQGGDNPPNCDSVLRYELDATGIVPFTWSARMYSSVFSLAVSDVAVYVGGHFCAAPKNGAPLGGVTSDWTGTANACDVNDPLAGQNPSVKDPDGAVFRKQTAALDPVDGRALDWDPGSNNAVGVFDLTLIERGLLMGHDNDRFNEILTGRSGFLDFGVAADTTPPVVTIDLPGNGAIIASPAVIEGTASDDRILESVTVRVKNITTGEWLQSDNGTLAPAQADVTPTVTTTALGEVDWSVAVTSTLPPGNYEVRVFALDGVGQTSGTLISSFRIPGVARCAVELNADDQPVISWVDVTDGTTTSVAVRRDGGWLATGAADTGSYTDLTAAPGTYEYVVRWRPDGVVSNISCGTITVPVPTGNACTAVLNADGHVILDWSVIPGITNYQVRDDDGWVATIGGTTFTDTAPTIGDRSYVVRHRLGGTAVDRTCAPTPITVPQPGGGGGFSCTAVLNADDQVVLNWSAVAGVDTYQVRDNDGWVGTVDNAVSFTDVDPVAGDRTYVIRYRSGGTRIDQTCSPDPLTI